MSFLLSPMRRSASNIPSLSSRTFSTTRPSQLARITLVGRVGTDPEVSDFNDKKGSMVRYVIGTNYGPRENRQTSWFRVTCFAPEGNAVREKTMGLTKGTLVYFEGDATMRQYEDSDGRKQSSLSLVQTKIEVLKRAYQKEEDAASES